MSYSKSTPPYGHPDRSHFERAHSSHDDITAMTLSLNYKIETLRSHAERQPELPDYSEAIQEAGEAAADVLRSNTDTENWTDYYRLLSHYAHLKELVYTPAAFSDPSQHELRRELVDGLFGISASILDTALDHHGRLSSEENARQIRGAMREHTTLALLNRGQDSSNVTLPASWREDISKKTDLVHYVSSNIAPKTLDIQVKGSLEGAQADMAPEGGLLIHVGHLEDHGFETSRAIIAELSGVATPEQAARLNRIERRLKRMIDQALSPNESVAPVIPLGRFAASSLLKSA